MPVAGNVSEGRSARATPYTMRQGRLRKRPNHELAYLRQLVIDLEEELEVLRQPDEETAQGLKLSAGETWKSIATKQRGQANATLMENLKLRATLERQARVERTLEAAIDLHVTKLSRQMLWSSEAIGRPRASNLSDELICALLDYYLEEYYGRTDEVLENVKPPRMAYKVNPEIQVEHGGRGTSFSHSDARLLPFAMRDVAQAIQNCLSHGAAGRPMERCRKLLKSDGYLQATTVDKLNLPNAGRVKVKTRFVQRRFIEANRIVLVWGSYVEIDGSVFVRLEEKGWVAVEPYEFNKHETAGSSKRSSLPGSSLRSVIRMTPIATEFGSEEEEKQHVGEMTDLVVGTYHWNLELLSQVLENLLVDGNTL